MTEPVLFSDVSSGLSDTGYHGGSEWIAGKANQYENLYFFRSAKESTTNEESSEGQEYIDPSLMASHTFAQGHRVSIPNHRLLFLSCVLHLAHRSPSLMQQRTLVCVSILFDGVDIFDHPFCPVVARWYTIEFETVQLHFISIIGVAQTHSSLVSAFPRICIRHDASGGSLARISYSPSNLRAESSSLS